MPGQFGQTARAERRGRLLPGIRGRVSAKALVGWSGVAASGENAACQHHGTTRESSALHGDIGEVILVGAVDGG